MSFPGMRTYVATIVLVLAAVQPGAASTFTFRVIATDFNDPTGAVSGQFSVFDENGNGVIDQPQEFLSWSFSPTGFTMGQGFFEISNADFGARPVKIGSEPLAPLGLGLSWSGAIFDVFNPGVKDVILGVGTSGAVSLLNGETGAFDFSSGLIQPIPVPATLPLFASGLAGLGWLGRRRRKHSRAA